MYIVEIPQKLHDTEMKRYSETFNKSVSGHNVISLSENKKKRHSTQFYRLHTHIHTHTPP